MEEALKGKVALVTGGGKGIGRAIAESLARRGVRVAVAGRNLETLQPVASLLEGLAVELDVRDEGAVREAVAAVVSWGGSLDLLVNNAGIGLLSTPLTETDASSWHEVIATNLTGTFLVTRAAWSHLATAKGQVLNVSSVAGTRGFHGASAYCASKHGVNGLTEVLRLEGAEAGIRALALCPGAIDTDIWGELASTDERSRMMTPHQIGELAAGMLATPRNIELGPWVVLNAQDPFESR
ncbi:MAG: SDR family oxidoreductase [Fimbriimonadaceae bacterium]|nr:SDR family oxidoreductase [Fimbriimonadaceae bacterium]